MPEAEPGRMQGLPREGKRPEDVRPVNVSPLPNQGVAPQPGLQPDLVAPAGYQTDFEQRRISV
jgi:hypothetical protein